MSTSRSVEVTAFSRELRRRMGQSRRGRVPTPPRGTRSERGRGCCLLIIIVVAGLIVYAVLQSYFAKPEQQRKGPPKPRSMAPPGLPREWAVCTSIVCRFGISARTRSIPLHGKTYPGILSSSKDASTRVRPFDRLSVAQLHYRRHELRQAQGGSVTPS